MPGGKTNTEENAVLDFRYGSGAPADIFIGLFTGAPTEAGAGTEVSGGAYARKQVTNNVTNWPAAASGQKSLATEQQFVQATAAWGEIIAFATHSAATAGTMYHYGFLVDAGKICIVDAGDVTSNTITSPGHGLVNTTEVRLFSVERFGTFPAGLVEATQKYFVVNAATDTFQVSLTSGGAAVDITGAGLLEVCVNRSKVIGIDDVFRFLANQLVIQES